MSEMRNWWTTPRWEMDMSALTNEIAALRSQLAAAEDRAERMDALAEKRRVDWQNAQSTADALFMNQSKMRERAETAERERDEARDAVVAMASERDRARVELSGVGAELYEARRERDAARFMAAGWKSRCRTENAALRHHANAGE